MSEDPWGTLANRAIDNSLEVEMLGVGAEETRDSGREETGEASLVDPQLQADSELVNYNGDPSRSEVLAEK